MSRYVIMVRDDETWWESATDEQRDATYARDAEFSALLTERGHVIAGGAELTHSRETRVVRRGQKPTVGPFAETVEQLTGFYLVDADDLDDVLEAVDILTRDGNPVEVRRCVD
jgi:hypothetical protein